MTIFKIEPVNYTALLDTKAGDMISFSIADGVGLLRENGLDLEDLICCDPDEDPVEEFMAISDYLRPGGKMGDYISSFGLNIEGGRIFVFRVVSNRYPALDVAERVAASVVDEYEWRVGASEFSPTWEMFELGGDDDVDYAGGHVQMACDFIRAVLALMEAS